jgi:hypothetical protein
MWTSSWHRWQGVEEICQPVPQRPQALQKAGTELWQQAQTGWLRVPARTGAMVEQRLQRIHRPVQGGHQGRPVTCEISTCFSRPHNEQVPVRRGRPALHNGPWSVR